jgi:hypothetical protein
MLPEDTARAMGRLKAVFRCQAIACAGRKFHIPEAIRAQVLKGLAEGCFDPHGAEAPMELDVLQKYRSGRPGDDLRFKITDITLRCNFAGPRMVAQAINRISVPL